MTALRSGQYWVGAGEEQLADYNENLQPKLTRSMNFLLDNKQDTGTLALRVISTKTARNVPRHPCWHLVAGGFEPTS
ncbi:hypothetical protein V1281_006470 [Nitrobacteraceae bacterium AZCC 2161]